MVKSNAFVPYSTKLGRWNVTAADRDEYHHLKREIFTEHTYDIEFTRSDPRILDLGSHIGLSCLYWLTLAPQAQITAVEPHPVLFTLLEQNIWDNNLENQITAIQKAVVGGPEKIVQLHSDTTRDHWWSTSSLTPGAWSGEQDTAPTEVETVMLSQLLTDKVDLVKMDIEGAELEVLEQAEKQLHLVDQILVEVHSIQLAQLSGVLEVLKRQFPRVEYGSGDKKTTAQQLPRITSFPRLDLVRAWRG
jgi:FkbM family methyltransferase